LVAKDISSEEFANGISSMELKFEICLASYFVIDPDHPTEREHLNKLGAALKLPKYLLQQFKWRAMQVNSEAV